MLKKVALYDFDNTIASGDTIVRLLKYDLKKQPVHFFYFFKVAFYYFLYLLHISSFEKAKSALLFPLDHMDNSQLKTFYENQPFIDWKELNRIEGACLLIYNNLIGQREGRARLPYQLGRRREPRC